MSALFARTSTERAAENNAQQQGVDLAEALFMQAEQLAVGVVAPLETPSSELSPVAPATTGHKPLTTARAQPTTHAVQDDHAASDANVDKMVELGFDPELSRRALLACGGQLRSALEWALASGV